MQGEKNRFIKERLDFLIVHIAAFDTVKEELTLVKC